MKSESFTETPLNPPKTGKDVPLLRGCDVLCERGDRVLFHQLSFSLHSGDILQISGPNGSGKTSLLRLLCGLSDDYEGEIDFAGRPIQQQKQEYRQNLLLLSHAAGVKEALTPRENLRWMMALSDSVTEGQIAEALDAVGLAHHADMPAHTLSAGQHRRIALARLWLSSATIWILDEPFTAIDQNGIQALESLLVQHAKRGGAVVLTTHHQLSIEYQPFSILDLSNPNASFTQTTGSTSAFGQPKDIKPPSTTRAIQSILKQKLLTTGRNLSDLMNPLLFFVMVMTLFPLGVSPSPEQLAILSPGLLWVIALLASFMAAQTLFKQDYEDGSLELLLVSPQPAYMLIMAKIMVYWLVTGMPLTLAAPILGAMVHLPSDAIIPLCLSLLLGTGCLSLVGAIGAGLTVGLKQNSVLLALIVLPLYTPILILGASAVQSAVDGGDYHSQLAFLGAYGLFALITAPFATLAALKINVAG